LKESHLAAILNMEESFQTERERYEATIESRNARILEMEEHQKAREALYEKRTDDLREAHATVVTGMEEKHKETRDTHAVEVGMQDRRCIITIYGRITLDSTPL